MQVLFEVDCTDHRVERTLRRSVGDSLLSQDGQELACELVNGVASNRNNLDKIIREHAPSWPVDQLSGVDRNILRIAIFEILFNNKVPHKAAINEAVELAKTFGSESIHRFINGVLGSVAEGIDAQMSMQTTRR